MRHYKLLKNKYNYYSIQFKDDVYFCKWQIKCANDWRFVRDETEKKVNSEYPVRRFKTKELARKHVEELQERIRMYNTDWVTDEIIN